MMTTYELAMLTLGLLVLCVIVTVASSLKVASDADDALTVPAGNDGGRQRVLAATAALTRTPGPSEVTALVTPIQSWTPATPRHEVSCNEIRELYELATLVCARAVPDWIDRQPRLHEAISATTLLECCAAELLVAADRIRRYNTEVLG